jgi:hypothetical protein
MAITNRYSSVARPDLIITDYRFLIHSMEKGIRNSIKSLTAIQRSDQKLWHFEQLLNPCATKPHHHRVSIPHPSMQKGIRKLQ